MPLSQWGIRSHAARSRGAQEAARLAAVAKVAGVQTAFLSHSHHDAEIAKGLQSFLQSHGWEIYINWEDSDMPDSPSRETAERIQSKLRDFSWFLFLATHHSMTSRWCPWEIGYADGVKPSDAILIIPTTDVLGSTHGSEYLKLYRFIDEAELSGLAVFPPGGGSGEWLRSLSVP